jgi:hypothetical protein
MLLALLACTDDPQLNAGKPELVVTPASVDFGEVVVGNYVSLGLTVRNEGYGDLLFESVALGEGTSPDFAVDEWPAELGHGDEGVLALRYTPDLEGEDHGTIVLTSNDALSPVLTLDLVGMGTLPVIDIDPEILYFGTVTPGESLTLTANVGAQGSGKLRVFGVNFSGGEEVAYSFALPADYAEPYAVSNRFTFPIDVTFTPPDTAEYSGEIWIESNDPDQPVAAIRLVGNTTDNPTEPTAPTVEIFDPDFGEYFMDDVDVPFSGFVFDADEPPANLTCAWFADGSRVDYGEVDPTGLVSGNGYLPVGEVELTLRCFDSDGMAGEDTVTVTVWPHDEPVQYTISGGDSVFDWFSVDDDITITLNGVAVFSDSNHRKDTHAPIWFEAARGDVIGVVASDINSCDKVLDALVLHWGTGASQPLNDAVCDSSCVDAACYSGDYNGPWPGIFLDETYTIAIP